MNSARQLRRQIFVNNILEDNIYQNNGYFRQITDAKPNGVGDIAYSQFFWGKVE